MKTKDFNDCIANAFDKKVNRDATPNGAKYVKYFSMNDAEKQIYSHPANEVPAVQMLNTKLLIADEPKLLCGIHLHIITPGNIDPMLIASAVESAFINPKGAVLVIAHNTGNSFTAEEYESVKQLGNMLIDLGAIVWKVDSDKDWDDLVKLIEGVKRGFASTAVIQIQSHPIKFGGVHGIQITYDFINIAKSIIQFFNDRFASVYNMNTLKHLKQAKLSQEARTDDRKARKVEGYAKD